MWSRREGREFGPVWVGDEACICVVEEGSMSSVILRRMKERSLARPWMFVERRYRSGGR
jgi:hypothetical protein